MRRFKSSKPVGSAGLDNRVGSVYKAPAYAGEAYEKDIIDSLSDHNVPDKYEFRNPNVTQRCINAQETLDNGRPVDPSDPSKGDTNIPAGENKWFIEKVREYSQPPVPTYYITFTGDTDVFTSIKLYHGINIFYCSGDKDPDVDTNWVRYYTNTDLPVVNGKVHFCGKSSSDPVYGFEGNFKKVSGNIMSLVDSENPETAVCSTHQFCNNDGYGAGTNDFHGLFSGDNNTISCPLLSDLSTLILPKNDYTVDPPLIQCPDTASYCLSLICSELPALVDKSKLPALNAPGISEGMYDGFCYECTGLTSLPDNYMDVALNMTPDTGTLPAVTLTPGKAVYSFMFHGCSSLASVPDDLLIKGTELGGWVWYSESTVKAVNWCYQSAYTEMFSDCTSLTKCPKLPATTLTEVCYGHMFAGCSALNDTSNLDLSAPTLAGGCYKGMFKDCTSLDKDHIPVLSKTTLPDVFEGQSGRPRGCYESMFEGCTALTDLSSYVLPATSAPSYCYYYMFSGCTSLTKSPLIEATTAYNNSMCCTFIDCSALTDVPDLLVTTHSDVSTCFRMFSGCTALVNAPKLPATIMTSYCYGYMFENCSSLNSITCLAESSNWEFNMCAYNWMTGVPAGGTFNGPASVNPDTGTADKKWTKDSVSGIPTGWTYNDI